MHLPSFIYILSGALAIIVIVLICVAKKIVKKGKKDDFVDIFTEEYNKRNGENDNAD